MEQSILNSTKKMLNVAPDDPSFDLDIITHINSAFSHLQQLGIGPKAGFQIEDAEPEWSDFLPAPDVVPDSYLVILGMVKSSIYLRVRLVFDPPSAPPILTAFENQLRESDSRLLIEREDADWIDPDPDTTTLTKNLDKLGRGFYEQFGDCRYSEFG